MFTCSVNYYLIDVSGNRLAVYLESIPEESSPTLHLSSTTPISLKQIEVRRFLFFFLFSLFFKKFLSQRLQTRSRHKLYKSGKDFDTDMARIFEKARRWHDPGTEAYGMTLLLQVTPQLLCYHLLASCSFPFLVLF